MLLLYIVAIAFDTTALVHKFQYFQKSPFDVTTNASSLHPVMLRHISRFTVCCTYIYRFYCKCSHMTEYTFIQRTYLYIVSPYWIYARNVPTNHMTYLRDAIRCYLYNNDIMSVLCFAVVGALIISISFIII